MARGVSTGLRSVSMVWLSVCPMFLHAKLARPRRSGLWFGPSHVGAGRKPPQTAPTKARLSKHSKSLSVKLWGQA